MAFPIDLSNPDLYSGVFAILGVEPTGDPVNDAVYKLLLPLIVLYMYSDFVITRSRFLGQHGKFKYILMLIVGYVIIQKNYYNLFATYSLPLLGIIMVWHAGSFIFGWGQTKKQSDRGVGYQPDEDAGGSGGIKDTIRDAVNAPAALKSQVEELRNITKGDLKGKKDRLAALEKEYNECEVDLKKAQKSTDRSAGDRMQQILSIERGIIEEARGIKASIPPKEMISIAPNVSHKLGIY